MSPSDGEPNRDHESKPEAPDPAVEPPTRLREAAAGMAEAQAWKGQQISKGWRKLMDSLRRPRPPSVNGTPGPGGTGGSSNVFVAYSAPGGSRLIPSGLVRPLA